MLTYLVTIDSWSLLLAYLTIALILSELIWILYCRTIHPLAKIPGPFLASFSRLWLYTAVGGGKLELLETQLHEKYGSLVRIAPNEVSCSDPAAIKKIYKTQDALEKSDFYTAWSNGTTFGKHENHFSVLNDKVHSDRRRIVNHVYSMSNILRSEIYIDQCSSLFIQKLGSFADKSTPIDLGQWLQMYAFDVIGELFFGRMFGFMQKEGDYEQLIQSLDTLNPVLGQVAVSATYSRGLLLFSSVASSSVRAALKSIDHVISLAKACVNTRQEELKLADKDGNIPRLDILQQLFAIKNEKGEKVDFGIPDIQYEAYVALFAGSDTTAIAMRSVFYHLSHHPDVLASLRKELDEAFPATVYPLAKPISYADAIKLPLLCATIKEAMRLHPSVGFTMPRISPRPDGLEIDGVYIAPSYRIGINAHIVQRDVGIFGPDAGTFRPQRWLPEYSSKEQLKNMDQCMLNFGAGTRTCIGKNISLSELHKLIPQVLRNFDLTPVHPDAKWTTHNYWFNKQTGLNFYLKRRAA